MAEIIHDRYKLLKKRGSGGTGEVWRARDLRLKREVAVKRATSGGRTRTSDLDRLRREAEHIAGIDHHNVVVVYDVVEAPGAVAIVMELVRGAPFLRRIRKRGLGTEEFLGYFRQLVSALEAVHASGVVHRDVNPRNVLVDARGTVKLVDFGLSARPEEDSPRVGGTLGYMPPESLRRGNGVEVTWGVDIWGLGFLAYQSLLGLAEFKRLYGATRPREWVRWVLSREPFRPLHELGSDAGPELSALVGRMLEKDPRRRYRRMAEVRADIERLPGAPARPLSEGARAVEE